MTDPAILWFVAGIILILLEFGAPGVVIGFFGVGAIITAITTWLGLTETLATQSVVFALSSVALLAGLRRFVKKWFIGNSDPNAENVDDEYSGKEAISLADFENGKGLVEIKGARWNARSDSEIRNGQTVIIVSREDLTLHVRPTS